MNQKPKGYYVGYGYRGWVALYGRYLLFANEEEYLEFLKETENE